MCAAFKAQLKIRILMFTHLDIPDAGAVEEGGAELADASHVLNVPHIQAVIIVDTSKRLR